MFEPGSRIGILRPVQEKRAPVSELALLGVASAVLGAALTASSDCPQPLAIATAAAWFALQGIALALLAWLLYALAGAVEARTGGRLGRHALLAALTALAALGPGYALFAGHGVQRTTFGHLGPYAFALLSGVSCWLLSMHVVPILLRGPRAWAWTLSALSLLALPGLIFLARVSYPGVYRGLHTSMVTAAGALGLLAALPFVASLRHLVAARQRLASRRVLSRASALSTIALCCGAALASAQAFGRVNRERKCLEGNSELAYLASYLREHVDLDGDGASPLFGGDDCADWDSRVGPAAIDMPRDGRDDDCDGRDGSAHTSASTNAQRRFHGDPAAAAHIRALAQGRPTVVLLVDALRDDRVGPARFPGLAALARESVRFTRSYANSSSTKTSLAAMLTGRVQPSITTPSLGQRLRAGGKRAAFVGIELVDDIGEVYPVLHGFDRVQIDTEQQLSVWGSGVRERTSAQLTRLVLQLLDGAQPPDLILVHYFDVHQWHALFSGPRERAAQRYDAAVRWLDDQLAPLLARRDQINLVLLADHGEALNGLERLWHTTYVGAEVVRVPWLIRVPGLAPATVNAAIGLSDVTPTLLDLLGVGPPEDFAGRSALELVGVAKPGFGPPIIALEPREWSILDADRRLRYSPYSRSLSLHDIATDPAEHLDLSASEPERAAALRDELLAAVRTIERQNGRLRYGYDH